MRPPSGAATGSPLPRLKRNLLAGRVRHAPGVAPFEFVIRWPTYQIDHLASSQILAKDIEGPVNWDDVPQMHLNLVEFKLRVCIVSKADRPAPNARLISGAPLDASVHV